MYKKLIVGLDPDLKKSGIAIYNKETKELQYMDLNFFDLQRWLIQNKEDIVQVKCEAGWLNAKGNFRFSKTKAIGERMAKNVGMNHASGMLIEEMLKDLDINYKLSPPLIKRWNGTGAKNGTGGKITHDELINLLKPIGIQMGKKASQETRDAILICLY